MYYEITGWIVRNFGYPIFVLFAIFCLIFLILGRPSKWCKYSEDDD